MVIGVKEVPGLRKAEDWNMFGVEKWGGEGAMGGGIIDIELMLGGEEMEMEKCQNIIFL